MKRLDRWLSLGLALTLGLMLGMLGFSLWDKMPSPIERVTWSPEAQWIGPQEPSYRFYVRRTFNVADSVQAAWLRISADNDFALYVNGQPTLLQLGSLSKPLGLASKLSDPWQNLNDSVGYRTQGNVDYLLANARNWKLTAYLDLTPLLHPGKNVVALEIQKGQKTPRVVIEGAVYSVPGAPPLNLTTGATSWQGSTSSKSRSGGLSWFDPDFADQSWSEAKAIGSVKEATYSRLSPHLFDRFLQGTWITGTERSHGEIWLRGLWQVPQKRDRAFIRFSGDGEYGLLINGLLVKRFGVNDSNKLHMYEVTNFLKTGSNTLAVRSTRSLDSDWSAAQNGSWIQNGPLGFFLDGWVETQNSITAPITTDSTWSALSEPIAGWTEGYGQGQPAAILKSPDPQEFQRQFEGNAYLLNYPDYLWHNCLWCLGGIGCALVYTWALGRFWLGRQKSWWDSLGAGAGLLLPATLFLIGIGLLKHRYAQAERGLLFFQTQSTPLILLGFVAVVLLTLLWSYGKKRHLQCEGISWTGTWLRWGLWFLWSLVICISFGIAIAGNVSSWSLGLFLVFLGVAGTVILTLFWKQVCWSFHNRFTAVFQTRHAWGQWFLLVLTIGIGFGLRVYNLNLIASDSDESTSLDAINGILRTGGAPVATSGIWYTRGPFYHYLLALWLLLVGNSLVHARFLSVIFGTATLIIVFIFTRKVTGKIWIALTVTALLAIDPWEVFYSRNARFYPIIQFTSLLTSWSFFKAFVLQEGKKYQYVFFIALTVTLLTQEVTITLIPCFLIGFLYFYRPFRLSVDWRLVLSSLMTMIIYAYDGIIFSTVSLTPYVALSSTTESLLKLHLWDITEFTNLVFFGPSRMMTLYSFFFFLGFIYFLKNRNTKIIFLFSIVTIYSIILTLLILLIGARYFYPVYPLFIMLSVHSAFTIMKSLGQRLEFMLKGMLSLKNVVLCFVFILLFSNIEPDRLLAGYHDAIVQHHSEISEYIRDHRQPGDVVMTSAPPIAATILGKIDYNFPSDGILGIDGVYLKDGRLIDRWGGGVVVTNPDQMNHILEKANRVWIQVDDHKPTKTTESLLMYDNLGQPVIETFGVSLRLWQRADGFLPRNHNQGQDLGNF